MRTRVVVIIVCAMLAASWASWAAWLRPRTAGIMAVSTNVGVRPRPAPPSAGPTAADEGEIMSKSAAGTEERPRAWLRPRAATRDQTASARAAAPHPASRASLPTRPPAAPTADAPRSEPTGTPPSSPPSAAAGSNAGHTFGPAGAGGAGAGSGSGTSGSSSAGAAASGPGPAGPSGSGGVPSSDPPSAPQVPPVTPTPVLTPPKVIATPGMTYPGDAFRLTIRRQDLGAAAVVDGTEGVVEIRALIRSTGEVRTVQVTGSSGSVVLDRAAVDAVRGWRFSPATRDGAPIDAYVTLRIRYVVR